MHSLYRYFLPFPILSRGYLSSPHRRNTYSSTLFTDLTYLENLDISQVKWLTICGLLQELTYLISSFLYFILLEFLFASVLLKVNLQDGKDLWYQKISNASRQIRASWVWEAFTGISSLGCLCIFILVWSGILFFLLFLGLFELAFQVCQYTLLYVNEGRKPMSRNHIQACIISTYFRNVSYLAILTSVIITCSSILSLSQVGL